ncbi:MAG: CAP domain-containing protein [bacterium]|nr:CAP domain-containing protein [bacterium]
MTRLFQTLSRAAFWALFIAGLYVGIPLLFSSKPISLEHQNFPELILPQQLQQESRQEAEPIVASSVPLRAVQEEIQSFLTKGGVLLWTNVNRITNNLQPLAGDAALDSIAESKMHDMFAFQYFAHVSPAGKDVGGLARAAGYEFVTIGENLALGNFKDDKALVQAWMDSPGHRANILGSRYTNIGIAVGKGLYEGRETWLAVQTFTFPLSACPSKPSPELLSQIETQKAQLESYTQELEVRKQEIDTLPQEGSQYNQKAKEYNDLIATYNELLGQTQALIAEYNQAIEALNACVKG